MVLKIILSLLIVTLFFLTVSMEWHIALIMLLVLVWKGPVQDFLLSYWAGGYKALWAVLWIGLLLSMPRYFALPMDRVRHYYVSKEGDIKLPPLHHWLINAILPEEELCNICAKTAKFAAPLAGIGQGLMDNMFAEQKRGNWGDITSPYNSLSYHLESPMSAAYVQCLNQTAGEDNRSFYLIRPKHYDRNTSYPLVVFCHGYLGNWKLYNGVLTGLENCIVLSIGTRDLSGIFFDDEIKEIHSLYIPLLEKLGYKIQADNISIMGLSNGGSAVNETYRHFSKSFKNIVFISTPLHHSYPIGSKVLVVGGALDPSGPFMESGYQDIKKNGGNVVRYWKEDGTHFIFVLEKDNIIDFLNNELGLK